MKDELVRALFDDLPKGVYRHPDGSLHIVPHMKDLPMNKHHPHPVVIDSRSLADRITDVIEDYADDYVALKDADVIDVLEAECARRRANIASE